MADKTLVMTRAAIGNSIGFVVGLIGLIVLPYFIADVSWLLRLGRRPPRNPPWR